MEKEIEAALWDYLSQLGPLDEAVQWALLRIRQIQMIPRKTILKKAGQPDEQIHFIVQGMVRCYRIGPDDKEENIWFLKEGDVIAPHEAEPSGKGSDEQMQTLEDTVLISFRQEELNQVFRDYPVFNYHGRLITLKYANMWYNLFKDLRGKKSEDRYLYLLEYHPELIMRVSSKHLAPFLDMGESTLSRLRSKILLER